MEPSVQDAAAQLSSRIPADRFEVLADPLGWRCRACRAEVLADGTSTVDRAIARLSDAAADHAVYCGRCDD